jgi:hypothetical protein
MAEHGNTWSRFHDRNIEFEYPPKSRCYSGGTSGAYPQYFIEPKGQSVFLTLGQIFLLSPDDDYLINVRQMMLPDNLKGAGATVLSYRNEADSLDVACEFHERGYAWMRLQKTDRGWLHINIVGPGHFKEAKSTWERVVHSIQVK